MVTRNATASRVSAFIPVNRECWQSLQYSHLYRGVYPFLFPEKKPDFKSTDWQEDVDRRLKWGLMESLKLNVLNKGDQVVCVQGWRGGKGHTNTIRIVQAQPDLGYVAE